MSLITKTAICLATALAGAFVGIWVVGAFMQHVTALNGLEQYTMVAVGGMAVRFEGSWVMWVTLLACVALPVLVASWLIGQADKKRASGGP